MARHRVAAILLFCCLLASSSPAADIVIAPLTLDEPLDYQVFQRQANASGAIRIHGQAPPTAERVRAELSGKAASGTITVAPLEMAIDPATHEFSGNLIAPAGGWYRLIIKPFHGAESVGQSAIDHVGVGEVFVIAGQSNSTNYGSVRQKTATRRVSSFDGKKWAIADDPQPGVQDGSGGGSFIPAFGDALVDKYDVPVGVASVGCGATSVRQWLAEGEAIEVHPTLDNFVKTVSPGHWVCTGELYRGLMQRIKAFGPFGFRAMLWHQGESDAGQGRAGYPADRQISGCQYRKLMEHLIAETQTDAGWKFPWLVAQATFHSAQDPADAEFRAAQKSLWDDGIAQPGPDTDALGPDYRDGVHFSARGLKAHGELWAKKVEEYLDRRSGPAPAQPTSGLPPRDTFADTWSATDELGRTVPTSPQVGSPRADRFVAMFYFLWQEISQKRGPFDVTKILATDPRARADPFSPLWGPLHAAHFWGEPLFGYYLGDDPWVLRKHAQQLSDAGVDVIIFDTSNRLTYQRNYTALMTVYEQMRREGNRTPQVAFLTPFGDPRSTVNTLYEQLYSKHLFESLWFKWEGKPLILADPAKVDAPAHSFFTFRRPQPDYFQGPTEPNMWSWLEVYPQHVFKNGRGEKEEMSVGVAQNAVGDRLGSMSEPGARGRSFHAANPPADPLSGSNFAEQWERAIQEDPQLVFVTGWNEWIAGRFEEFNGIRTPPMFVDEFDEEHSRDVEPMKGGHGDNYYYQLVSFIRRFKGARPLPQASAPKTILPATDFAQWNDVRPDYQDDLFDTSHRNHPGFAHAGPYTDESGRNDLDLMKVARDDTNVYFYVRTREPITEPVGDNWMFLLIDTDHDHRTGWEGYDLLVNRSRPNADTCTIEQNAGGWSWKTIGTARIVRRGREMQIEIRRKFLNHDSVTAKLAFDFKWGDNVTCNGDILQFLTTGDVAPNGRFNYRYRE